VNGCCKMIVEGVQYIQAIAWFVNSIHGITTELRVSLLST
jgi:hypothetical protein